MDYRGFRTLFVVVALILSVIPSLPLLNLLVRFPSNYESFSELSILGPNHTAEGYPFNVRIGEKYNVFVDVSNHLGGPAYYVVYVKLRNQTQPSPNSSRSTPSPLLPLYESRFSIDKGESWEIPFTFAFTNTSHQETNHTLSGIFINDLAFSVDSKSKWDSRWNHHGFFYQMFFELWLYDVNSKGFQFHNRFVGIWLNMTV